MLSSPILSISLFFHQGRLLAMIACIQYYLISVLPAKISFACPEDRATLGSDPSAEAGG
jgi:hypothetical protein